MKVAVFGAGAVGGLVAARLALAGVAVSVVARGAHLEAIRGRGLRLRTREGERVAYLRTAEDAAAFGPQDVVIVATKAHALAAAAPAVARLLGPETVLVPAQNGLPWWYCHKEGGALDGEALRAVDPEGEVRRLLPPERVVGCVVYVGAAVPAPGVVEHSSGERFVLGEPDGSMGPRLEGVAELLRRGGFVADTTDRIRDAIWLKLWGNLSLNPVSALTGGTVDRLLADERLHAVMLRMMEEARGVADRLGIRFETTAAERLALAGRLGAFKTSMLQDFEAGRPMEVDALLGAVAELGRRLGVATPSIDAVEALVRVRGRGKIGS